MKLLTRERAQELANELDVVIIGYGPQGCIRIYDDESSVSADFMDRIEPKYPWPYPRATDADRGKAGYILIGRVWIGPYVILDAFHILPPIPKDYSAIRLADPDNLTQPPPDGLED